MTVAPQHGPSPATFDRRAYVIDRLYALWWTVLFDSSPDDRAKREHAALVDELRSLPE